MIRNRFAIFLSLVTFLFFFLRIDFLLQKKEILFTEVIIKFLLNTFKNKNLKVFFVLLTLSHLNNFLKIYYY